MDANKLTKAKIGIILNHPFFATLMMRRQFVEDTTIKTSVTDGNIIKYNPAYYDGLSNDELQGSICHEIMHIAMLHHTRREGRNLATWNKAADYAINPILLNSNMALPKDHLVNSQYDNMSTEQIFNMLPEEIEDDGNNDAGGCGGVEDSPGKSQSEITQAEAQTKLEVAQAMQIAKQQGKLPGELQRLVEEILQPKVAWQEVLARFLCEIAKNDYSFSKPNMRYLHSGFILPSLYNVEVGRIVLVVDTSFSIDEELLNQFAGEMQDICSTFNTGITVIYVDTIVQGTQEIEPDEPFVLEAKGKGGTDFIPAFEWLTEQGIEPKAMVYFTDMACNSFPQEPDFPVLWAKYGSYQNKNVPFGEVIQVD